MKSLVRERTVGHLFLDRNRPVNSSSHFAGNRRRMCDCKTNCLNRLSRLSDNDVSLNRQHASSRGMKLKKKRKERASKEERMGKDRKGKSERGWESEMGAN